MSFKEDVIKLVKHYYHGIEFKTIAYSEKSEEIDIEFELTQSQTICKFKYDDDSGNPLEFGFGIVIIKDKIFLEVLQTGIIDTISYEENVRDSNVYEIGYFSLESFLKNPFKYLVTHQLPSDDFEEMMQSTSVEFEDEVLEYHGLEVYDYRLLLG